MLCVYTATASHPDDPKRQTDRSGVTIIRTLSAKPNCQLFSLVKGWEQMATAQDQYCDHATIVAEDFFSRSAKVLCNLDPSFKWRVEVMMRGMEENLRREISKRNYH